MQQTEMLQREQLMGGTSSFDFFVRYYRLYDLMVVVVTRINEMCTVEILTI